ncbi:hypothetical protein DFJ74DRAFT_645174 [Hyaloraphidium curvatum]|nr:hypothetical protein DFJ74DRAFT_645174 [Hyaloraphidium curvatum]
MALGLRGRWGLALLCALLVAWRLRAGPREAELDAGRPWTLSNASGPGGEWPFRPFPRPSALPSQGVPARCTLVAHVCFDAPGDAAPLHPPDQLRALLRLLWTARRILNCRVVRPYLCVAPRPAQGSVRIGELFEAEWNILGGADRGWAHGPDGFLPPPEYNASLKPSEPAFKDWRVPCLVDAQSARRPPPPGQWPHRPFACAETVVLDPRSIGNTSLVGTFGVPFPLRLPTSLGGEAPELVALEAAYVVRPADWVRQLAMDLLAHIFLGDAGLAAWDARQLAPPGKDPPGALPSPPRFSEKEIPPYLSSFLPAALLSPADLPRTAAVLTRAARAHFASLDRSLWAGRGDEEGDSPPTPPPPCIVVSSDAPPDRLRALHDALVSARGAPPGTNSTPTVLLLPLLLSHPPLSSLLRDAESRFPRDPISVSGRRTLLAAQVEDAVLGCASRAMVARGSARSGMAREGALTVCRGKGKELFEPENWDWLPEA